MTETTETNMAQDYADGIVRRLYRLRDAEAPFGWTNETTDETTEDRSEVPALDEDGRDDEGNEWRAAYPSEWFADVLDFRYVINGGDMSYRGAQVWVTIGGPNAWIDTEDKEVHVAWGSDRGTANVPVEFCEQLDEYLSELWDMSRDK